MPGMLNTESLLTIDQAIARLPAGVHRNRATIWRWCRVGIRGVKLEHGFAGRTIVTTLEAPGRFFRGISDANPLQRVANNPSGTPRRPRRSLGRPRQSSIESAEEYLAELGA
jgi:hypothetical protein